MTRGSLRGSLLAGVSVLLLAGAAVAQQATQDQQPLQPGQETMQQQEQAGQEMMQQEQAGQVGQEQAAMGAGPDIGEDGVRRIQEALDQAGHDVGPIDGQWGPQTESALREFQEAQGMEATGEPDEETLTALGLPADELLSGEAATGAAGMPTEQTPTAGGLGAQEGQTEGQAGQETQQPGGATQQ
jgi:Putative peptidoglycan binding domain